MREPFGKVHRSGEGMGRLEPLWQSVANCPTLEEDLVHVWSLSLERADMIAREYKNLLSISERNTASDFVIASASERYVVVHGTLRKLLAGYLDLPPNDIHFTYGVHGKPRVCDQAQGASLCFSLSHSDDMALFAFSYGRRIGVDLERIRDLDDRDMILAKTFSTAEIARLRSLSLTDKIEGFYRGWTSKEAYLKATGEGISRDLRDIEASVDAEGQLILTDSAKEFSAGHTWRVEPLLPAGGYMGALAVEGTEWQLILMDYPSQPEISETDVHPTDEYYD